MINGAAFSPDTNPFNVSLNNLTAGTYEVEVWVDDSRGPGICCQDRSEQFDSGPTLLYNTTQSTGGAGQWVIGTFTLISPGSETFALTSFGTVNSSSAQINALEVRMVPEPSSIVALCGLGAMGLFLVARRHRRG